MASATVTSKGQVTVPKEIRDRLNVETGDRIDYIVDGDGRVYLECATISANELRSSLGRYAGHELSTDDIDKAVGKALRKKFRRR